MQKNVTSQIERTVRKPTATGDAIHKWEINKSLQKMHFLNVY